MCGLFGFVGNHPKKTDILRTLCVLNEKRGDHSAGIATINETGKISIFKKAINPRVMALHRTFNSLASQGVCNIGHTRWATTGEKTSKNAHPFRINNVVGAHNGMVHNYHYIGRRYNLDFPVDSQYLIWLLDKFGNVQDASGLLTVSYHDIRRKPILSLSNGGNPLSLMCDTEQKWMAYSSDYDHLCMAMCVNNIRANREAKIEEGTTWDVYMEDNTLRFSTRKYEYSNRYVYNTNQGTVRYLKGTKVRSAEGWGGSEYGDGDDEYWNNYYKL